MVSTQKLPILVVGATGQLGSLITKHALTHPNLNVNILIRNPDKNKELVDQIKQSGGNVLIGDVTKPETLKDSTKGIHTVISALIGDDSTVFEGQKHLAEDAVKNGVKRFVPSDISLSADKAKEGEHPFLDSRIKFRKYLETTPVKGLHVTLGVFTQTFFFFMTRLFPGLHYYHNPDQKIDITTYEDTAKFVAAAVAKPDRVGDLKIHGDALSINEIAAIYNKVTGKNVKPENRGSIDDLKKNIEELRQKDFFKSILLTYEVFMFDGRGKLDKVDNGEFPEIKPLHLEEYIKANPGSTVFPETQ